MPDTPQLADTLPLQTTRRAADRLASAMHYAGVTTVFSLSGNQIMPVYDAFNDCPIRVVHTRHEAAAVFMAEAYARVSGGIGVALVTAAPGFANALGALYSASMSEVPVVLLSGDSPVGQDGTGAFQQFDQVAAASPFVKASVRLSFADDPAQVFAKAVQTAQQGTPGPVHIALPFDVIEAAPDPHALHPLARIYADNKVTHRVPGTAQIATIMDTFTAAERPLILAGPHVFSARRRGQCGVLSAALGAPVVVLDSPRGLRDPAHGALRTLLSMADCVCYLGKPVDFTSGFGADEVIPANNIVFISDCCAAVNRASAVFRDKQLTVVVANAIATVEELLNATDNNRATPQPLIEKRPAQGDCPVPGDWCRRAAIALNHRQLADTTDSALYSKAIIDGVAAALAQPTGIQPPGIEHPGIEHPGEIVICDGGEFGQWAQAFTSQVDNQRLTNGPSGAIGASLPYAIGAQLARPEAVVIAIMGDGTAGFHLAEFETAARESLGITVLIGNDSRWNAEHHIQLQQYGPSRTLGCELSAETRYDLAASGLGCEGVLITDLSALPSALANGLASSTPTCINVIMPGAPAPQYNQPDPETLS